MTKRHGARLFAAVGRLNPLFRQKYTVCFVEVVLLRWGCAVSVPRPNPEVVTFLDQILRLCCYVNRPDLEVVVLAFHGQTFRVGS